MQQQLPSADFLREEIASQIDLAIERTMSVKEFQKIFKQIGRKLSARKMEDFAGKLGDVYDTDKLNTLFLKIRETVTSHLLYDDKFLTIYHNVENLDHLENQLKSIFENYKADEKKESEANKQIFFPKNRVDLREDETVFLYQYLQVRELTVKEEIDPDELKDDLGDYFSQIYGLKTDLITCFDSIIIDLERNLFIVMIDLASILPKNELNVIQNNFTNFIKKQLGASLVLGNSLEEKVLNLFPCIQAFYDEQIDDRSGVTEIYFKTTEGTAHHEKLNKNNADIRKNLYHESGVNGLKNTTINGIKLDETITPYRISKKYYDRDIEVSLNSSYHALSSGDQLLYSTFVYGSRSYEDIEFVINKLLSLR